MLSKFINAKIPSLSANGAIRIFRMVAGSIPAGRSISAYSSVVERSIAEDIFFVVVEKAGRATNPCSFSLCWFGVLFFYFVSMGLVA